MAKKKIQSEQPGAFRPTFTIQLNDEQLVHVLAALEDYKLGTRKNARNDKKGRIQNTKEFVEIQAFGQEWHDDPEFQKKMRLKYWGD